MTIKSQRAGDRTSSHTRFQVLLLLLFSIVFLGVMQTRSSAQDNSTFVSETAVPTSVTPGQTFSVTIVMQNTGSGSWYSPYYKATTENPFANTTWGVSSASFANSISPGSSATITFNLTAPSTAGVYHVQFSMMNYNGVAFGALTPDVPVTVGSVTPGPTGLTATATSATQINLAWTALSGATSYTVSRSTNSGGPYTAVGTPTGTTYSDTTCAPSTTYYYVVSATTASGATSNSGQVSAATPAAPIPPAPTGLTATAASSSQINLSWTASTGATSYTVSRSTTSGGPYTSIGTSSTSTYSDSTCAASTAYYYVVSASNGSGTSTNSSQASATTPAAPIPAAPTGLTATAASSTQINLTWSPSTGATSYSGYRSLTSGGPYQFVGNATGPSGVSTALTPNTTYYYVVTATNASGTSGYSAQASATTQASPAGTTRLAPIADSYVNDGSTYANSNFGTSNTLVVKNIATPNYDRASYLKFDLTGFPTPPTSAQLILYLTSASAGASTPVPIKVYGIADTSWSESAITWNTALANDSLTASCTSTGTLIDTQSVTPSVPGVPVGYGWNLTSYLQSHMGQVVTLLVINDANVNAGFNFGSRESGATSAPVLTLVVPLPPAPPTNLTASPGNNSVTLSYTASTTTGCTYNVYRGATAGGESATPILTGFTGTSAVDNTAVNGTTYYYYVKAVKSALLSVASNEVSTIPYQVVQNNPYSLSVTDIYMPKTIQLQWTPPTNSSFMSIDRQPGNGFWNRSAVRLDANGGMTLNDAFNFVPGTLYTYTLTYSWTYTDSNGKLVSGTSTATATVRPFVVSVGDNQSIDARTDPRFALVVPLNHNFGTSAYKGGLFAGFNNDNSKVGRSLLQFSLPASPNATLWPVASMNAFYAGTASPANVQIGCQYVPSNWTQSTVNWSTAPSMTSAANSHPLTFQSQNYITSVTPGTPRNDLTDLVGIGIKVGANPMTVTSLGRWCVSGNSQSHDMEIIDGKRNVVPGSKVTVNMAGAQPGTFQYVTLPTPIVLSPNSGYIIASSETQNGDQWLDSNTITPGSADAQRLGAAIGTLAGFTGPANGDYACGPVDFQYTAAPWMHWNMINDFAPRIINGGPISFGLIAADETVPGWAYFAKKEYNAADAAVLMYATQN